MEIALAGRHALVCGSTQGIGRAVAIEFSRLGARVSLLARDAAALERTLETLDRSGQQAHSFLAVDMSDTAALGGALHAHVATHGDVGILINNTGGPAPGPAYEATVEQFANAFRLHLLAFQTLVQAVLPGMRAKRGGRIINIISTSVKQPLPDLGVSNTIRGAVAQWGKTLANELGPFGITVNNVLPGSTDTERLHEIIRRKAAKRGISVEDAAKAMMMEVPLRRFATPEELAYAVAFLAGPSAAYINGINLPVDGGRTGSL